MTFPAIVSSVTSLVDGGNTTNHLVSLPPAITAGNKLVGFFVSDGAPSHTWPNPFVKIGEWAADKNAAKISIAEAVADGSEGATITVVTSASERSAAAFIQMAGAEDIFVQPSEIGTPAVGTSNAPDPAVTTVTGKLKDIFWVAFYGADRDTAFVSAPAGYINPINTNGSGSNSCGVGLASLMLNAASENPGVFGVNKSEEWVSGVVAIHPLPDVPSEVNLSGAAWPEVNGILGPFVN